MHAMPFVDAKLLELRRSQREVLLSLPDDVREPLLPSIESALGPPPDDCPLVERALRERVVAVIESIPDLESYLERARRHRFATAIIATIDERYRELAGDAPAAMDEERGEAELRADPSVVTPTYEEQMALARIVPFVAWADHLAERASVPEGS